MKHNLPALIKIENQTQIKAEVQIYNRIRGIRNIPVLYNREELTTQPDFGSICMS